MPATSNDRPGPAERTERPGAGTRGRRGAGRGSAHLDRSTEWAGLRAGDPVEVAGVRARSTTWSFLAHVRNLKTGEEWVEVVGGRAGTRAVRSFRTESIFAPSPRASRRATRAPLAEAPRLPL